MCFPEITEVMGKNGLFTSNKWGQLKLSCSKWNNAINPVVI